MGVDVGGVDGVGVGLAVGAGPGVGAVVAGVLVVLAVLVLPPRREALERHAAPRPGGEAGTTPDDDEAAGGGARRGEPASGEVASALALLALGYRSGLPTWDVLDAVGDGLAADPAADLRQVGAALRWGASDAEAWGSVGAAWSPAARAVEVAHLAGVPPAPLLLAAADDLREAELERVEVAAARVGVRLVAPLGLVLLPAFCLTTVVPLVIALARDLVSS
ncbi:type II secretion system F family protein [Intrasporangium sp. YIM S08009]|uniref:type II secretion system F family protein n=1 Tax=Intrasporangium zincisolvens TaxID=3080018 RepID=UPI002B061D80|nr:type II secretion system F family protein [Intrasporangium sp. YIM S08009]